MTLLDLARQTGCPVCVDLDGTLIRRHSLWDLLRAFWQRRQNIAHLLFPLRWPLIKSKLSVNPTVSTWPYRPEMIHILQQLHQQAIPLFLVTGANEKVAKAVSMHLGLFQEAIGSTADVNLVGPQKAHYLVQRFGHEGFIYIGDSWRDIAVWRHAAHIGIVPVSWLLVWYMRWYKRKTQVLYLVRKETLCRF